MPSAGYFLCITSFAQLGTEVSLSVLNTAGIGTSIYGRSTDHECISLWLIYKAKKSPAEVKQILEAYPVVQNVTVIPIRKPLTEQELQEVKTVLSAIGWDLGEVSDTDLSLYLNAVLNGQSAYYIDIDHHPHTVGKLSEKIRIQPIEKHPGFSPDWIKGRNFDPESLPDMELTMDDIHTETVVDIIEEEISLDEREIPPPIPPPGFKEN